MILGVTEGFKKQIKLIGVGYKINYSVGNSPKLIRKNNVSFLTLNIGFSHPVSIEIPSNIYVNEDSKKANSDPSSIELFSTSLTDLNNFVYSIYKIKPIEKSFKGTGITIITP
jgi:large subunit ribosomal protein L6